MTMYALINPDDSINRMQSNVDPNVQTKAGYRWLPVQENARPDCVDGLERATFQYVLNGSAVEKQWTVSRVSLAEQKAAVKSEAQRRIIAITGQTDLIACMIKQSNANMRANELTDKRVSGGTLTAEEELEATALRNLATALKAIRAASNVIELMDPIPLDYCSNTYWGQ
jgi:hypothetical protein